MARQDHYRQSHMCGCAAGEENENALDDKFPSQKLTG